MPDGMNGPQCYFDVPSVKDERCLIEKQICDILTILPFGITQEQVSHLWKIGRYESTLYLERLVEDGYLVKEMLSHNTSAYYHRGKYQRIEETQ